MRHDRRALASDGEFEDELVCRVVQRRAPQEVNVLVTPRVTEVVDEPRRLRYRETQFLGMANQRRLVFERKRYRDRNLEPLLAEKLQNPKRRAASRPKRCDQNAAVENDEHSSIVSHTIPHQDSGWQADVCVSAAAVSDRTHRRRLQTTSGGAFRRRRSILPVDEQTVALKEWLAVEPAPHGDRRYRPIRCIAGSDLQPTLLPDGVNAESCVFQRSQLLRERILGTHVPVGTDVVLNVAPVLDALKEGPDQC